MHARSTFAIAIATLLGSAIASAQPAAPPSDGKVDAKALMQSGVKLLEAKDYLGALAVFKDAYARFRSAKILLNISTTLKLLDRRAEAANAYQRYLDAPDTDPSRRAEVSEVIADLDKSVGRLEITVTPPDAQVQVTEDWVAASEAKVWRVTPGSFTVAARKEGFKPDSKTATIVAGERTVIMIRLDAIPVAVAVVPVTKPIVLTEQSPNTDVVAPVDEGPRSRFGAIAGVHVSVVPRLGSALLVGGTVDVTDQLSVDIALMLGPGIVSKGMATLPPPSYGAYVGASFAFLTGDLRPRVSGGIPVFASDGAHREPRAAGGLEYRASRKFSLTLDVGAEWSLNPQNDIREIAVVPAVGATGRL
jgi:hypothetical protein